MDYILGIDQGGTKTAAALMNEKGSICGTAIEEGAYFPEDGMEKAMQLIGKAVAGAMQEAGITGGEIRRVVAGVTGVDWPGDEKAVQDALSDMLQNDRVFVCNDCVIAMYGGTRRESDAIICAGTGLNCAIRKTNKDFFVFGDYLGSSMQGGGALAQRGARKVFDAQIGIGEAAKLRELYLSFAGVQSVDELLQKYMQDRTFREGLKLIVPQLICLAGEGDGATCGLLEEFAKEICDYLYGGLKKLDMAGRPLNIVLAGGVFKGENNPLTLRLTEYLQAALPGGKIICAQYEPAVGACVMGMLELGRFSAAMEHNLSESAEKYHMIRN